MGGLHIALNFLKVMGEHMGGSGLKEMWVESDILGPVPAEQHYNRGIRAHKLSSPALWSLILPGFLQFAQSQFPNYYAN